jgi:hypothetical protein
MRASFTHGLARHGRCANHAVPSRVPKAETLSSRIDQSILLAGGARRVANERISENDASPFY